MSSSERIGWLGVVSERSERIGWLSVVSERGERIGWLGPVEPHDGSKRSEEVHQ